MPFIAALLCFFMVGAAIGIHAADVPHSRYHDSTSVYAKLVYEHQLHAPYMSLYESRFSRNGDSYPLVAVRLSTSVEGACALKALFVCGMHAREPFSTEVCMNFILLTLRSHATRSPEFDHSHFDILVVPMLNPWGTDTALGVDPCARTNERGVDLNRNFPCAVPLNASHPAEENPGPAPFSEPQTAFLRELIVGNATSRALWGMPDVAVNLHTGAHAIIYPYDAISKSVPFQKIYRYVAAGMRDEVCPNCVIGSGADVMYPTCGTFMDWVAALSNQTLSFTWELFYSAPAHEAGACFETYNPFTASDFKTGLRVWTRGMYTFLDIARALYRSPFTVFDRFKDSMCPDVDKPKLKALKRKYASRL